MSIDRERMLARARDGEEKSSLARVLDRAEMVLRSGLTQVTGFHDPYNTGLVVTCAEGGYPIGPQPGPPEGGRGERPLEKRAYGGNIKQVFIAAVLYFEKYCSGRQDMSFFLSKVVFLKTGPGVMKPC